MSDASGQSALRRQQFDEILAEYLDAVDGGAPPELDELLMRYPDFEPELHEFFADQSRVGGLAAAFRVRSSDVLPITEDYRAPVPAATEIGSFDLQPAEIERQKIEIGSVFAGDYRIFDVKAGGMGRVYLADWLLARSHGSEVRVAIKTVADFSVWKRSRQSKVRPIDEGIYRDIVRRFEREADAWIHIEPHDNILQAFFVIDVGAKPYLVMDYADSGDLQSWIAAGRMTVPLAVNFAIQFCRGMAHVVRTAGMVHRDIKPANVLVKDDRIVKIADFGLSKSLDILADDSAGGTAGTGESAMSQAGGGTLPYMAPEQFGSLSAADTRSDVFSFGAMFYEMLTSRRLFEAANVADHLVLRIRPAPAAHELNPEVPEVLSAVIARCVSYDREHRYQSFDEILADLTRACDTIPDHPSIPSDPRPVSPESRFVQETYSLVGLCNYEKAAQRADEGLSQFPQQVELLINKGKALFHLGDADGAMECTRQALAIRPRHTRAWANLAFLHLERNEPAEALEAAEDATRHDPELAPGWCTRGWCEHMLGHSEKGAQSLRRAVKLEPHNWQTHLALGRCLTRLGKDGEALRALKLAASINPRSADVWENLAGLLSDLGAVEEAKGAVDRCLTIDPSNANVWAIRGLIRWRWDGDASAAQACLDKSLELAPDSLAAAVLSQELGDTTPLATESTTDSSDSGGNAPQTHPHEGETDGFSRCRYWMCSCGGVFEKEDLEAKLAAFNGPGAVAIVGSRTCTNCGATYECSDIFAGKHDVPRQHWRQLEQQHGKPATV